MTCGCCHEKDVENPEQRWAFWFAGFGSGPDTVNSTFWTVAILYLASLDAKCGINPADNLSSGVDGLVTFSFSLFLLCFLLSVWNPSFFCNKISMLAVARVMFRCVHRIVNGTKLYF